MLLPALALVLAGALTACGNDTATDPDATETTHSGDHSESAEPTAEPSETAEPPAGNVINVTVAGGEITPAPDTVSVPLNEDVTIAVTSDIDEEAHVHGYDKELELEAGKTTQVTFTADIPGVFEVELHESGDLLFELEVQ
ncbi:MAG: hypothetical protein ABL971_16810 [Vicinamibacterales bacterium]